MRIDIHTHTKKIKTGDATTRNINASRFGEILKQTDVKIIAITNHNHFDLLQYNEFAQEVSDFCQVWPGVELDVSAEGKRAHLIVVANPRAAGEFEKQVNSILQGFTPDNFLINLSDVPQHFSELDVIYIAHYHSKKPDLLDKDIDALSSQLKHRHRLIKEAVNSISAGIYISHGHNSIYGSDVQNWEDYAATAYDLPELRLPVSSFEQFCLLLERDETTINTLLDHKTKESIPLNPFGPAELVELNIYNDINIIFGSKGTGKTELLKALAKYYNDSGHRAELYEASSSNINEAHDICGDHFILNLEELNIDDCREEIASIRQAADYGVTSVLKYHQYFASEARNKIAKSIEIRNYQLEDDSTPKRRFAELKETIKKVGDFQKFVNEDRVLQDVLTTELLTQIANLLQQVANDFRTATEERLLVYRTATMFNTLVNTFAQEISKKTGQPIKPNTTGFREYGSNRIKIDRDIKKVRKNLHIRIESGKQKIGSLGDKGDLMVQTNLQIQTGKISDSSYSHLKSNLKKPQKEVAVKFELISKHVYSNELFEKIRELNEVENGAIIESVSDLILFNRHFVLNGSIYSPSTGEASMVLLQNELKTEKDIYIIDEPEKSLGNDYISNVIVPLLKERAKMGKKIIIATHDANIAVRTLPYNSIYRSHDLKGYFTFVGNPFSNNLVCLTGDKENLDWKEISMKTLEGGRQAFGERRKIYGHDNT